MASTTSSELCSHDDSLKDASCDSNVLKIEDKKDLVGMQQLVPVAIATEMINEQIADLLSMVTSARANGASRDTAWMKAAIKKIEDYRAWRNSLRGQHVFSSDLFATMRNIGNSSRESTTAAG